MANAIPLQQTIKSSNYYHCLKKLKLNLDLISFILLIVASKTTTTTSAAILANDLSDVGLTISNGLSIIASPHDGSSSTSSSPLETRILENNNKPHQSQNSPPITSASDKTVGRAKSKAGALIAQPAYLNNKDLDKFATQEEPDLPLVSSTIPKSSSSSTPTNEDNVEDEFCELITVVRKSLFVPGSTLSQQLKSHPTEVFERSLVCSHINEYNYHQMVKNIYRRQNKLTIQQIHLTDSEPLVLFSAIDLICDRFDCSKLTVFNVSSNEIHDGNVLATWLASWFKLEVLDFSNTSLKTIESIFSPVDNKPSFVLKNLTHLYLDENRISQLDFDFILERMPSVRHLSIVNNLIFNINCNESLRTRVKSQFESISLAGNAINCEKNQLWLMKQFQSPITSVKFPDYDQIKCSAPERLYEMTWAQRVSVLETKICDDCDCKSLKRTAISVDCHSKNLTALPDVLPLNTKILNLTSNHIDSLAVPPNSQNWENVTYVYLGNNRISSFQPLEINSKFMRNLAALDIRRNKFQEFPSHIFEQFINLDQVHLSDNPWLCDCESTFAFQEWLQRQFHKVGDKEDIRCGVSGWEGNGLKSNSLQQRLSSRVIYRLSKSELCPQDNLEEPYDWLDIANFIMSILIVLIVFKVILDYSYQRRTKRWPHFFKLNY